MLRRLRGGPFGHDDQLLRAQLGDVASVAGLIISIWVLVVARKAREAAEEASALGRKRSLVEDLEQAGAKMQQVGGWVRDGKWELVQLRAQEVLGTCDSILSRWGDHLGDSANGLRTAVTELSSVARQTMAFVGREPSRKERQQLFEAELRATELISEVLGRARWAEERS